MIRESRAPVSVLLPLWADQLSRLPQYLLHSVPYSTCPPPLWNLPTLTQSHTYSLSHLHTLRLIIHTHNHTQPCPACLSISSLLSNTIPLLWNHLTGCHTYTHIDSHILTHIHAHTCVHTHTYVLHPQTLGDCLTLLHRALDIRGQSRESFRATRAYHPAHHDEKILSNLPALPWKSLKGAQEERQRPESHFRSSRVSIWRATSVQGRNMAKPVVLCVEWEPYGHVFPHCS